MSSTRCKGCRDTSPPARRRSSERADAHSDTPSRLPLPGFEPAEAIAEETAREIDVEVKRIMTEAHDRALQILREHRLTLDGVVLLVREVVEGDEVRLLAAASAPPALRVASA